MKILHLSDTHNKHRQLTDLPDADVFVHCGDFTDNGTEEEVLDFLNWLIELPYPHKIFMIFAYGKQQALKNFLIIFIFYKTVTVKLMDLSFLA